MFQGTENVKLGKYSITIEFAQGIQTYQVDLYKWVDLQSSTYLEIHLSDGRIVFINDFSIRKAVIQPNVKA